MKQLKQLGLPSPIFKKVTNKQQDQADKINKTQDLRKRSSYGAQLGIRKSLSFLYGGLRASYLFNLFRINLQGKRYAGESMLKSLELRLDTLLVNTRIAQSFACARQLINHRGIFVNGRSLTKPSYQLQPGDIITLCPSVQHKTRRNLHSFLDQHEDPHLETIMRANLMWYKNTYSEVNYKTLEIVILFPPQQSHFPVKIHTKNFATVFRR